MAEKIVQQIEFSAVFFDTLFGLVLFFSLDSFLDIKTPIHFIFYLFTMIILVHWWLVFKSADDIFAQEVTNSAADILFGIIYIILIEYVILSARSFQYVAAGSYLLALLCVDFLWVTIWRYVGEWRTKDREQIRAMEGELKKNFQIDLLMIGLLLLLVIIHRLLTPTQFILCIIVFYSTYIALMFKNKIIDLKVF